ncbi:MAG: adenine phosphoribosyltransferase [Candidatus Omnitrophica bacterium]|nr:adenine phosphoribosyltransferase [Candidatus Omnitrophota bacterium]
MTVNKTLVENLKGAIRDVPDFPSEGIIFKDITTLLKQGERFKEVIDLFAARYGPGGPVPGVEAIVAIEARGFILGGALAVALGVGFVPVRKQGKLPAQATRMTYELEYGRDTIEMHQDALSAGQKVVLLDDVIATGGTAEATVRLIQGVGAEVLETAFLIELGFLPGRSKLEALGQSVFSILKYD